MQDLKLQHRIFYFASTFFCFWLPFGTMLLSWLVVGWGIASFFCIDKQQLKKGFSNKTLWLMFLLFLLTVISALLSDNKAEAATGIELRWGFLFFPWYFFCFNWPAEMLKKCLVSFVSGCLFACLFLLGRAVYEHSQGTPEAFFYTTFSALIHPSYFAMYLITALAIIFVHYPNWFRQHKKALYLSWLYVAVFIITIFLCSSKMGIITLGIITPVLFIYKWKSFFSLKKTAALAAGIALLLFFAVKLFPEPFSRLQSIASFSMQNIDKTSSESTTVRVLIWEQCLEIIKHNSLFGVGVGDANDVLYQKYEQNGLTGALSHRLNAHNQYFQTFIGLGVIGFILLLLLTFGEAVKAFLQKNILLLVFCILIILNFLVESMLQTSAGTLYFLLFLCLFNVDKLRHEL